MGSRRLRIPFRRRKRYRGISPLLAAGQTMSSHEYEAWYEEHAWSPVTSDGLELQSDLTPAEWIAPRLSDRSFKVKMTSPAGYEAYARLPVRW
jgi:hypothetical protein